MPEWSGEIRVIGYLVMLWFGFPLSGRPPLTREPALSSLPGLELPPPHPSLGPAAPHPRAGAA